MGLNDRILRIILSFKPSFNGHWGVSKEGIFEMDGHFICKISSFSIGNNKTIRQLDSIDCQNPTTLFLIVFKRDL